MDKLEKLKKLKNLLDEGVPSLDEYQSMKNEIINVVHTSGVVASKKVDNNHENKDVNVLSEVIRNSQLIDGVYLTENETIVSKLNSLGNVSGSSGWSGFAESLGIKNAQKELIGKAKSLGANVIHITFISTEFGIKMKGRAFKIQ